MMKLASILTACALCCTVNAPWSATICRPSGLPIQGPCAVASATPAPTAEATKAPAPTASPEATAPVAEASMDAYARAVVEMTNEERAKQGLDALVVDADAVASAQLRAAELAQSFSHTRPNGESCFTALDEVGAVYSGAGENIARGQMTAERVMASWMSSPGHYANIMQESYTRIGVAHVVIDGVHLWVQLFLR